MEEEEEEEEEEFGSLNLRERNKMCLTLRELTMLSP